MKPSRRVITQAIKGLIDNEPNQQDLAEKIAAYLVEFHRTSEIESLIRDIQQLRFDQNGVLEITVQSASPLTDYNLQMVKDLFQAEKFIIKQQRDRELISGVRVRALDKVLDLSAQARLQRLRTGVK